MRWDSVAGEGYKTPNERFFVRNHTATPLIDPETWQLRVFGGGLAAPRANGDHRFTYATSQLPCGRSRRSSSARATGAASSPASRGRARPGRSGGSARSASPRGPASRSPRCSSAPGYAGAVDVLPGGLDATVVSGGVDLGQVRRPLPIDKALDEPCSPTR